MNLRGVRKITTPSYQRARIDTEEMEKEDTSKGGNRCELEMLDEATKGGYERLQCQLLKYFSLPSDSLPSYYMPTKGRPAVNSILVAPNTANTCISNLDFSEFNNVLGIDSCVVSNTNRSRPFQREVSNLNDRPLGVPSGIDEGLQIKRLLDGIDTDQVIQDLQNDELLIEGAKMQVNINTILI